MDTVENTVELPFTYRTMVSNTFRPPSLPPLFPLPSFLKAISTVPSLPPLVPACGWLIDMETGRQGIRTRIPPSRINGSYPPHPSYPDPPKDRSRRRFPDNLKSSPSPLSPSHPPPLSITRRLNPFHARDYAAITRVYARVLRWKWRVTDRLHDSARESYFRGKTWKSSSLSSSVEKNSFIVYTMYRCSVSIEIWAKRW